MGWVVCSRSGTRLFFERVSLDGSDHELEFAKRQRRSGMGLLVRFEGCEAVSFGRQNRPET